MLYFWLRQNNYKGTIPFYTVASLLLCKGMVVVEQSDATRWQYFMMKWRCLHVVELILSQLKATIFLSQ